MNAGSWQELQALVRQHHMLLNHIHVSAVVCRLPKVVDPTALPTAETSLFSRFLREVSDLVTIRLSTFDPRAIANVLWAVSKLGYSPAPATLNTFLFEAYVRLYEFNAQELANLAWALANLATLGNRPVPVWMRKYTLAALPRVVDLKPQELAHMTWALSRLFPPGAAVHPSPQQVVALVSSCVDSRSRTASAIPSVAQTVGNLSLSGTTTGDECQRQSGTAKSGASAGVPSAGAGDGADTTPSGAVARPQDAEKVCPPAVDSAAALPDLVSALGAHAVLLLPKFRCGELVMAVTALHALDPAAGLTLLRQALPHLLRTASSSLSPQDLTNLWQVLGKCADDSTLGLQLQPSDPSVNAAKRTGVGMRSIRRGSDSARTEASVAAGGGVRSQGLQTESRLGRHHLHALLDVTARELPSFTAQGLSMVLWSWARLRLQPSKDVAQALFQRFCNVLPAQATFQGVAISLWAAAHLGLRPPPAAISLFLSCARLQASAAKPGELQALLWALQHMRCRPSGEVLRAFNARLSEVVDQLMPTGVQGVLRAYAVFGAPVPRQLRDRALAVATANSVIVASGEVGASELGESRELSAVRTAVLEPTGLGGASGSSAPAGGMQLRSSSSSLLQRPPCDVVRYFATLAGVGVGVKHSNPEHRRASEMKLQLLRWRLAADRELRHAMRDTLEGAVRGRLRELDVEALCALLSTFVRLRLKLRADFLGEVHEQVAAWAGTGRLTHWQAAWLLSTLGRLHARPPPMAVSQLLGLIGPHLELMNDDELLSVVHALARLRFRPSGVWLQGYFLECMARADSWPAASLGLFLGCLAGLGLRLSGPPCRQLQVLVYRRKQRAARNKLAADPEGARQATAVAVQGFDMKRSLCAVCSELSGCTI